MAKQSAVTSASPNPLATLTPSAAALHLVSSVDSSPLPPSTANPYTGVAAGAGAMVNPFATLGAVGENLAIPQPRGHSQTLSPLVAMLPQWPAAAPAMDGKAMSRQIPPLQLLSQQGISQDQWVAALQLVTIADTMGAANPAQLPGFGAIPCQGSGGGGHPDVQNRVDSARGRDRDHSRSPPAGYGCPSHLPGWDRRQLPRRLAATIGRPPHWKRLSHSPLRKDHNLPSSGPKLVEWDSSIGPGNIKVLSRTLFVSGISSEAHLRSLFNKFGIVQTCIVNIKKRHAFIKMISCQDAVRARDERESFRSGELQLRTGWGVGFGPRDCSDYQTGISVIPIERLTNADRKWLLTAKDGGTGGRPIKSGMVVEEPDIEICAGFSSKAIGRRIAASTGGCGGRPDRNGFCFRRN
ncbi:Rpb7-binding protein seb1 [Penicillium subrubescens]|uniref:Rpb7-binding protein seb1 n=1 Tax=Penicillium subrubescens TaxID=1316194 RepID=A0A1Q5THM5_9EURO|nr:Rpb7-binding protein seb1 [Penicillium subrubescens]